MATAVDSERTMGKVSPYVYTNGRVSPPTGYVLTRAHVQEAIARSSDDGCTLDFSNKNLVDVGEVGAEELSLVRREDDCDADDCPILRIALVGNRLCSLPLTFARLSRLRYLTLRSNSFSVFPEVLTTMSSLEILDFSRNKIRRLPTNPGTLVNLRVMSISRNKIRKLPSYMAKFRYLSVLKADHNPVEWPPKHVMEAEEDLEEPEAMQRWVDSLKEWMAENVSEGEHSLPQIGSSSFDEGVTPHARSFSIESENSIYSSSSYTNSIEGSKPERPLAIDTESISPTLPSSISVSPESYLPTPEGSLSSADDDTARPLQHGRNKSYAPEQQNVGSRSLASQKSLPDLRTARAHFMTQVKEGAPMPASESFSPESQAQAGPSSTSLSNIPPPRNRPPRPPRQEQTHGPPDPMSARRAPSMDYERNSYFRRLSTLPVSTISRTTPPALLSVVDSVRGILFAVSQVYQSLQHYTVYAIDERLSSVLLKVLDPASAYMLQLITALDKFDLLSKKGCPPPSVCRRVIECCRDNVVMFGKAVGVLALQLKVLASRDDVRYSRQMLLVLYGAMAEISNSWRGIAPQLETIELLLRENHQPPRSRAGVSVLTSSTSLAPPPKMTLRTQFSSHASSSRVQIPPIAEHPEPSPASAPPGPPPSLPLQGPAISRARSAQPSPSIPHGAPPMKRPATSEGRSRINRRHAGSFSVKDVEIGRSLPSNHDTSPPSGGVASGSNTPTPRSHVPPLPRSTMPLPGPAPPLPSSTTSINPPFPLPTMHSRQGSSQNGSGASTPVPLAGPSRSNLDVPSNSSTLVDKEAIDAMSGAVRAAPAVWSMLEVIANEMPDAPVDLRESLAKAQDVTHRLGENIKAIQEGLPSADRKALREDAHVFVKTVIALSKVVKDYSSSHQLTPQLRTDITKLTNATQEFVMLLHVSSFSPSSASRPYSPMPNGATANGASVAAPPPVIVNHLAVGGEAQGGANLSRSRSAQPSASSKLIAPASASSVPRSALPHQTFKIPVPPSRLTAGSRLRNGDTELVTDGHT